MTAREVIETRGRDG